MPLMITYVSLLVIGAGFRIDSTRRSSPSESRPELSFAMLEVKRSMEIDDLMGSREIYKDLERIRTHSEFRRVQRHVQRF